MRGGSRGSHSSWARGRPRRMPSHTPSSRPGAASHPAFHTLLLRVGRRPDDCAPAAGCIARAPTGRRPARGYILAAAYRFLAAKTSYSHLLLRRTHTRTVFYSLLRGLMARARARHRHGGHGLLTAAATAARPPRNISHERARRRFMLIPAAEGVQPIYLLRGWAAHLPMNPAAEGAPVPHPACTDGCEAHGGPPAHTTHCRTQLPQLPGRYHTHAARLHPRATIASCSAV